MKKMIAIARWANPLSGMIRTALISLAFLFLACAPKSEYVRLPMQSEDSTSSLIGFSLTMQRAKGNQPEPLHGVTLSNIQGSSKPFSSTPLDRLIFGRKLIGETDKEKVYESNLLRLGQSSFFVMRLPREARGQTYSIRWAYVSDFNTKVSLSMDPREAARLLRVAYAQPGKIVFAGAFNIFPKKARRDGKPVDLPVIQKANDAMVTDRENTEAIGGLVTKHKLKRAPQKSAREYEKDLLKQIVSHEREGYWRSVAEEKLGSMK